MEKFIKSVCYDDIELKQLSKLCRWFESGQEDKVQKVLDFLQETPEYTPVLENRYLHFIRARLRAPDATLEQVIELSLDKDALDFIYALPSNAWPFEYDWGDEAFSILVDFCGALVHANVELEGYLQHQDAHMKKQGDFDYGHLPMFSSFPSLISLNAKIDVYSEGWYGKILKKVMRTRLAHIGFDHSDCTLVNDSPYLGEFLMFVQGYMVDDELTWDFFQSTPFTFPSSVYLLQYNWKYVCKSHDFEIPKGFSEFANHTSTPLWLVEP